VILRRLCQAALLAAALLTAVAWCVSEPMARNWADVREPGRPLAQEEAVAAVWAIRCAAPLMGLLAVVMLSRSRQLGPILHRASRGLSQATTVCGAGGATATGYLHPRRLATWLFRGILAAWLLLALARWGSAVGDRLAEWPVYRLNPGSVVLPNMSESNRDVIRYVQSATPEDARILMVSDQAVFFLSYYLHPRAVFHKVHPDAERVIPQPNQQRQLAAYRFEEIPAEEVRALRPDFVLEYFEGPAYVDRRRLLEDRNWVSFVRQLHRDAAYVPPYNVELRPFEEVPPRP
jgi:hypothetical protein